MGGRYFVIVDGKKRGKILLENSRCERGPDSGGEINSEQDLAVSQRFEVVKLMSLFLAKGVLFAFSLR